MPGKVFISCGQKTPRERKIARRLAGLLKKNFHLDPYLAFEIQSMDDIMKITDELKSADYYLFVDFFRKRKDDVPVSLFTHQELALAHHLKFKEFIAFQEHGCPSEGFIRYVLSNPDTFESEDDLLQRVEDAIKKRGWVKTYSRNLVVSGINCQGPFIYRDHTGQHLQYIWHAKIENRRSDTASINTVCILDSIEYPNGRKIVSEDRGYLKWATLYQGYQQIILSNDSAEVDIFAIYADKPGVFLHSSRDIFERTPIITDNGNYKLHYKIFSVGLPQFSFSVNVNYKHSKPQKNKWKNITKAKLLY